MRKARAFRGGANKPAPPCESLAIICYLATVPVEQLQRGYLTENPALRKNGLQHPAKGGSTPAFACQRAAIAPLPCLNFCLCFSLIFQIRTGKFKNVRLQQGKQIANWIPIKFASQMWATRPHLANIFEKLLDQKTFHLPAAWYETKTF